VKKPPANSAQAQIGVLLERAEKLRCMAQALDYLTDTCDEIAGIKDMLGAVALHASTMKNGLETIQSALAAETGI